MLEEGLSHLDLLTKSIVAQLKDGFTLTKVFLIGALVWIKFPSEVIIIELQQKL